MTRLFRALFLRLTFTNGANGVFNRGIGSLQHTLSFLTRIGEHLLLLLRERGEFLFVVRNGLLEFLFAVVDVLALVFPIHLVAHNVLEILVAHHIVLAHQISRIANHIFGKPNFARDFHRKRTTGIAYLQHKEGLHLRAVVEHRTVDHMFRLLGKVFQVLIVRGDDATSLALHKLFENRFCQCPTDLRFCATSKLVDEEQTLAGAMLHHHLHVE